MARYLVILRDKFTVTFVVNTFCRFQANPGYLALSSGRLMWGVYSTVIWGIFFVIIFLSCCVKCRPNDGVMLRLLNVFRRRNDSIRSVAPGRSTRSSQSVAYNN
jgi:hypothetical protein